MRRLPYIGHKRGKNCSLKVNIVKCCVSIQIIPLEHFHLVHFTHYVLTFGVCEFRQCGSEVSPEISIASLSMTANANSIRQIYPAGGIEMH